MCKKVIGLTRRLSISVPRKGLFTTYKSFVRPYLNYGDIFYDKPDQTIKILKINLKRFSTKLALQ